MVRVWGWVGVGRVLSSPRLAFVPWPARWRGGGEACVVWPPVPSRLISLFVLSPYATFDSFRPSLVAVLNISSRLVVLPPPVVSSPFPVPLSSSFPFPFYTLTSSFFTRSGGFPFTTVQSYKQFFPSVQANFNPLLLLARRMSILFTVAFVMTDWSHG